MQFDSFPWINIFLFKGGEKRTIEFMESQSIVDSSSPLLKEEYAYGVVEHPFPLNCFIRDWDLGPAFYHAVKVGIVQYVCTLFHAETLFRQVFLLDFQPYLVVWHISFPDDTEIDLRTASHDSSKFWCLWRRKVWLEIWVRCSFSMFLFVLVPTSITE